MIEWGRRMSARTARAHALFVRLRVCGREERSRGNNRRVQFRECVLLLLRARPTSGDFSSGHKCSHRRCFSAAASERAIHVTYLWPRLRVFAAHTRHSMYGGASQVWRRPLGGAISLRAVFVSQTHAQRVQMRAFAQCRGTQAAAKNTHAPQQTFASLCNQVFQLGKWFANCSIIYSFAFSSTNK